MENENNKLKNKPKNLKVRKAARTVAILVALGLVGGAGYQIHTHNEPKVEYIYDDETGLNKLDGTITYEDLKKYKVVTVNDLNGNDKYYLGRYHETFSPYVEDLLSGLSFNVDGSVSEKDTIKDVDYISKEDISDYLVTFNEIKPTYTYEDLVELQEEITEYKEKTLTK